MSGGFYMVEARRGVKKWAFIKMLSASAYAHPLLKKENSYQLLG